MKRPFDDAYLLSYSAEHVCYEVDQFFKMAKLFDPPLVIAGPHGHTLNMALIEACAVHLRNVVEFLYANNPQPTDVAAIDFCANWTAIRPAISKTLENARVRANKEVAHLTTQRIPGAPPEKAWPFAALAAEIRPIIKLLATKARASALSSKIGAVLH